MNILIGDQAKQTLKLKKIPDNCSGIFFEISEYCWWFSSNGHFDTGECETFDKSFKIIKNLTSTKK
jgi:hypothetical protein